MRAADGLAEFQVVSGLGDAPELKMGSPVSDVRFHFLVRYVDARQLMSSQPEIEQIPSRKCGDSRSENRRRA
jgi:hypothetical protein